MLAAEVLQVGAASARDLRDSEWPLVFLSEARLWASTVGTGVQCLVSIGRPT